jgi:tetratricopeptide (TPR) repeat protein
MRWMASSHESGSTSACRERGQPRAPGRRSGFARLAPRSSGLALAAALVAVAVSARCGTSAGAGGPGVGFVALADSLAAAGFPDEAITEYERALFLGLDPEERGEVLSRLGFCHARLDEWDEARAALDRAVQSAADDSLKERRELDRAVVLIAAGATEEARAELGRLARLPARAETRRRAGLLLLTSAVRSADWALALTTYRSRVRDELTGRDSLEEALGAAASVRRKSPEAAFVLSSFLPGSGQLYAGRWRSGLGALALNAALGFLVSKSIADGDYGAGAIEFLVLFRRYYQGNQRNARLAASDWNATVNRDHRRRILDLLRRHPGATTADAPR